MIIGELVLLVVVMMVRVCFMLLILKVGML